MYRVYYFVEGVLIIKYLIMRKILFILAVAVMFTGCAAVQNLFKTSLELRIVDSMGAIQHGAEVSLFKTEKDLIEGTKSVAGPSYTNKKGVVKFKKLPGLKYWVKASKGDLTNLKAQETSRLRDGKKNKIIIIIE